MVRVGISVEGLTEERFVEKVLAPYLVEKQIYLTPINLHGNVSVDRIRSELKKMLPSFDFVTTFYDFYGFKKKAHGETKASLEKRIQEVVKAELRCKVIPYVQMYEFEGLLFSSPEAIAVVLDEEPLIRWADTILKHFNGDPEQINDSPQTAPSKRLSADTEYHKVTDGPDIADRIGVDEIRRQCRGFDRWLNSIEALVI